MKILAYRFSAMGDVALCLPVIKSIIDLNPDVEITFVTRKDFEFLFSDIPRVTVFCTDFSKKHKGLIGLYRLYKELRKLKNHDAVADLHQVLRTHILNFFFRKLKVSKIEKNRKKKKELLKKLGSQKLKHTVIRYSEVFKKLGLETLSDLNQIAQHGYSANFSNQKTKNLESSLIGKKIIGIAPFAKHFTKIWPIEYVEELIVRLKEHDVKILLFGGPEDEKILKKLESLDEKIICLAGSYDLKEELELMKKVDVMLAMDSGNMHLATLCKRKVISIWGGTHPAFGFYPIREDAQIVQLKPQEINCRPCSLFGRHNCPKSHFDCMLKIKPDQIYEKIMQSLG